MISSILKESDKYYCIQGIFFNRFYIFLYMVLSIGCTGIISGSDPNDTEFQWESNISLSNLDKNPLNLETMFGIRLRMTKSEYNYIFDSLIDIGVSNKNKEIKFGETFEEYFEVKPFFYKDTLYQVNFTIRPWLTSFDNKSRNVDMLDVISKLYTNNSIHKTDTIYKFNTKEVFLYQDVYGWIKTNRLIKVIRRVQLGSPVTNYNFDYAEFSDIQLKKRYDLEISRAEIHKLDSMRDDKLNHIIQ